MKVAIVLNTSWNIYNFRKGLVQALIKEGHTVITIAPEDSYSKKLKEWGCEYYPVKMDSRGVNPIKDLALIFELFGIYKRTKPDIILHYTVKPNIYGTIAGSLLRKPIINNVCGLGTAFIRRGIITKIVYSLYKLSFRFSSKVFFQNWEDCNLFLKKELVDPQKSSVIAGSGIDLAHFKPVNSRENSQFTFLMVSRLIRDKGVLEYIEAIRTIKKSNPSIKFQLLGQKDSHHKHGIASELVDSWSDEGLIEYLGTTDDVKSIISGADCVVLPSYREGTPRTLLEAASMAKPIITTKTTGCKNVVTHEHNGLLCRVGDSNSLADAMSKMSLLPVEDRKRMGENGRIKMVNEYDEKLVIDAYLSAIKDLS